MCTRGLAQPKEICFYEKKTLVYFSLGITQGLAETSLTAGPAAAGFFRPRCRHRGHLFAAPKACAKFPMGAASSSEVVAEKLREMGEGTELSVSIQLGPLSRIGSLYTPT